MGNEQPQVVSKFAEDNKWLTVAQTSRKHLIQNKLSREIVEKHFLQNVAWNQVNQDALIYQWRKDPKTSLCSVEVFEIRKINQEEQVNCMSACANKERQVDLLVYTQHVHKLYEHNPKMSLSERDQMVIFKGIVEGIDMLSVKFGEFGLAKDMVGYNTTRHGKVWIHQNYCINQVQIKKQIINQGQRQYWQKQIIDAIVGICKLSSVDRSIRSCKFFYPMEYIIKNQLFSFKKIRQAPQFKEISIAPLKKGGLVAKQQHYSKDVELSTSRRENNELVSTEDRQRVKIFNQTFDSPFDKYQLQKKDRRRQEQQVKLNITDDPNYRIHGVEAVGGRHPHLQSRQIQRPSFNETLNDAADYHRRHPQNRYHNPLYQIKERPAHYALLDELQDSRSSRASSKMIDKEHIKMVDSWMLVQQNQESESSNNQFHRYHPYKKGVVLDESIILKRK